MRVNLTVTSRIGSLLTAIICFGSNTFSFIFKSLLDVFVVEINLLLPLLVPKMESVLLGAPNLAKWR
jgi:hypothetical protein